VNESTAAAAARIIGLALREDRVKSDLTSRLLVPARAESEAVLLSKAEGVLAGLEVFRLVFARVDPSLSVTLDLADGACVQPGDVAARIRGKSRSILAAERTALNFVCHLSGVATLTARCLAEVAGSGAVITDTRKTMPGLRLLEKAAVAAGGGRNHRFDLADGILIEDNHLALAAKSGLGLAGAIARARAGRPAGLLVEVEVTSLAQAREAADAGADMLLLDNMSPPALRSVAAALGGRVQLEASGGITLANLRAVAATGVQRISIGALTHSAPVLDLSLEFLP
jgi:nicotinate-nucleotide pyrophosphorylase (carboxylating)